MTASTPAPSPPVFPVLLVNFIGFLGYSLIIPILVFLVERFGGNAFVYGLMGAIYPTFQLVGAPILGRWSDRVGRRKALLVSQLGTFLAWCFFIVSLLLPVEALLGVESSSFGVFSISFPLLLLFAARALDGLTGGNVSVANAYMSDISDDSNRKANFGKLGSSTSLGFVIGPAAAGLLGATALGELLPV
ncbi:MAG: MFS transporter, partial [Bacteroidota bacterium]